VRVHERREGSKHEIMATRPSKLFLLFIVIWGFWKENTKPKVLTIPFFWWRDSLQLSFPSNFLRLDHIQKDSYSLNYSPRSSSHPLCNMVSPRWYFLFTFTTN
jgi:hypothetical protein